MLRSRREDAELDVDVDENPERKSSWASIFAPLQHNSLVKFGFRGRAAGAGEEERFEHRALVQVWLFLRAASDYFPRICAYVCMLMCNGWRPR